ncbi:MAG: protein kinase [Acidobacteriia bacterium]|nr:protein kinase [Terriglobia bacterium]
MVGQTISHYRILSKLGEGGMGVVYKAEDTKLRRTVALKFLPPHLAENRERFLREAQAAAALNHPNICTVFEIDEEHGFLAMEFIDGPSVKEKIAERPLPLDDALDIATQACAGLQAAHEKGIVHRDIKPANLMLTAQGQVKIMDFGLAQVGDRTRITKTRMSLGTPAYMSPEQAQGQLTGRTTDIWSLGVVLYEMLTGRPPFHGETDAAFSYAIVHVEPDPLSALRTGIPIGLDRCLAKLLAKDPAQRYQHVEDLLVDLRHTPALKTVPRRTRQWRGYVPWAIAAAAILAALAVSLTRLTPASAPVTASISTVIPIPLEQELIPGGAHPFDVSRDGSKLVYVATEGGRTKLFLREVDRFDTGVLAGTEDAIAPFFSPDGRWIGFSVQRNLFKVASSGGGLPYSLLQLRHPSPQRVGATTTRSSTQPPPASSASAPLAEVRFRSPSENQARRQMSITHMSIPATCPVTQASSSHCTDPPHTATSTWRLYR